MRKWYMVRAGNGDEIEKGTGPASIALRLLRNREPGAEVSVLLHRRRIWRVFRRREHIVAPEVVGHVEVDR